MLYRSHFHTWLSYFLRFCLNLLRLRLSERIRFVERWILRLLYSLRIDVGIDMLILWLSSRGHHQIVSWCLLIWEGIWNLRSLRLRVLVDIGTRLLLRVLLLLMLLYKLLVTKLFIRVWLPELLWILWRLLSLVVPVQSLSVLVRRKSVSVILLEVRHILIYKITF